VLRQEPDEEENEEDDEGDDKEDDDEGDEGYSECVRLPRVMQQVDRGGSTNGVSSKMSDWNWLGGDEFGRSSTARGGVN
jgi:hypothetical protein